MTDLTPDVDKAMREYAEAKGFLAYMDALAEERDLALAALDAERARSRKANDVIDRLISEAVERWNTVTNDEPALHAWLGLTWKEYAAWVQESAPGLLRAALAVLEEPQ